MERHTHTATKIDWNIINALRGMAALMVVINHSRGQLFTSAIDYAAQVKPKENWGIWEWLNMFILQHTSLGTEFVILFFVLSGFSIAHSLANPQPTGVFYLRRFIRLYPAYVVGILWAIGVFIFTSYVAPDVFNTVVPDMEKPLGEHFRNFIALPSMISNLLYNPVNNFLTLQYWSLPLEVVFYLLAPFIVKYFRWYGIITIVLYVASWVIYGATVLDPFQHPLMLQFLFDFGIFFFVGMLIYKHRNFLIEHYKLPRWLVVVLLALLFEVVMIMKGYVYGQVHTRVLGAIMIVFSYIILIGAMKYKVHIRWLEKIGAYSYTLYVTHIATIHIINAVCYKYGLGYYTINKLYIWYIGIAMCLLCAWLLYWVAEYPSTKYLNRRRKAMAQAK